MTPGVLLLSALLGAPTVPAPPVWTPRTEADVRRVTISLGFAGQAVFLHGQVPPDLEGMVAVVESPADRESWVVEQGRLGPLWLGLRQHRIAALPALYLVKMHDPARNVLRSSGPALGLESVNRALAEHQVGPVGPPALEARAVVERVGGLGDGRNPQEIVAGFWELQERRGLYGVDANAIRVSPDGMFSYWVVLPAVAPEGRYTITTHYLLRSGAVTERCRLVVRKSGAVALVTRAARRRSALYGITAVMSAIAVGWLAGALGRGRNGL